MHIVLEIFVCILKISCKEEMCLYKARSYDVKLGLT